MSKLIKKHRGHLGRRGGLRYGAGSWAKYSASAKMRNTQKPCQYALAKTSTGGGMKKKTTRRKECSREEMDRFIYHVCLEMPGKCEQERTGWGEQVAGWGGYQTEEEEGGGEATCGNAECGGFEVSNDARAICILPGNRLSWLLQVDFRDRCVCVWESRNRRSNEARCLPTS